MRTAARVVIPGPIFALLVSLSLQAVGCRADAGNQSVAQRLLEMPAPVPSWSAPDADSLGGIRPPPEDGPIELLLAFWSDDFIAEAVEPGPTEKVRSRLLEAAIQRPERIPPLLQWFPRTPDAFDRLKAVHDKLVAEPDAHEDVRQAVHDWLMTRSRYFRPDLIAKVKATHWRDGFLRDDEDVEALARLDWPAADSLLKGWVDGKEPHLATLGKAMLYRHAAEKGDKAGAARGATLKALFALRVPNAGRASGIEDCLLSAGPPLFGPSPRMAILGRRCLVQARAIHAPLRQDQGPRILCRPCRGCAVGGRLASRG